MSKRDKQVPVGYIPAGTTNDFANSLHISKDMLEAADTAANGVPFPCDVGVFNDDIFVYIAAFGLFTDVSYETKQSMKKCWGIWPMCWRARSVFLISLLTILR